MRRPIGMVLIGLGAFFLTLAPLVRFYVADQVVVAPLNRYQVTLLESKDSTYFDQAELKTKKGATLKAISTVRGDVRANEGDDDIAVWDATTNIFDEAKPDNPIQIQAYRIAFDRRSSVLTDCCGTHVDGDSSVRMAGSYGLLLPLANVEQKDYPVFDPTTKQSAPMEYSAVEKVQGLTTYRFTQTIPLTKTAEMDTKLPAEMLGLPEDAGDQKVARYTEAYNTVWVDPRTGIPVKHRRNIRSTVQTADGKGKMIAAQADLITVEKDQKAAVDMANKTALKIDAVRSYIPAAAILLGLVLLGPDGSARSPPRLRMAEAVVPGCTRSSRRPSSATRSRPSGRRASIDSAPSSTGRPAISLTRSLPPIRGEPSRTVTRTPARARRRAAASPAIPPPTTTAWDVLMSQASQTPVRTAHRPGCTAVTAGPPPPPEACGSPGTRASGRSRPDPRDGQAHPRHRRAVGARCGRRRRSRRARRRLSP